MNKILFLLIFSSIIFFYGCKKEEDKPRDTQSRQVEYSPDKDMDIQRYNIEQLKKLTTNRYPCDTISLMEYVLNNYPEGTYTIYNDRTLTYDTPKPAIIYHTERGSRYVFTIIARSKPGERLIETKNIIGFDQSYIDLDSTKLGTAFFYLVLLKCEGDEFIPLWEAPIPSHGGFNNIALSKWNYNNTGFMKINFHFAQGVGHIDYNYFFVNGLTNHPHLLMLYKGINFERTLANINDDNYPDYYEHLFYDLGDKVYSKDSLPFIWVQKDSIYRNMRNGREVRPY